MALGRRLLGLLAMGGLALLVYAGVSLAFSVPVDDATAHGFGAPGGDAPRAGSRAVVVPIVDAAHVATQANGGATELFGQPGALLAHGEVEGSVPATASGVRIARALLYVGPDTNRTDNLTLENVPMLDENGTLATGNLTVNLTALAGNATGFVVKTDRGNETLFVAEERVIGHVVRFDSPSRAVMLFTAGSLGFVAPIVALVATHRAPGVAGAGGAGVCRECRAELEKGADFCMRCGAWAHRRKEEESSA